MTATITPELVYLYGVRERLRRQRVAWERQRRPAQTPPPGDWTVWAFIAGRGAGKTRAGAEWVREEVMAGRVRRVALVAPTAADARDVMVEGESGLMAVCDRYGFRPVYEPSKRRLTFPNGALAFTYSADEPERLRGPQHDLAWCDEVGAWRYADAAWSNLQFGLRLGSRPRTLVTTTPRPIPLLRTLLADTSGRVAVTHATSYENLSNLAPSYRDIIARWEGTRLGRQELLGELLEDVEGALWSLDTIEAHRVPEVPSGVDLTRIVVAVDPSATATGAETGIVVAARGSDGHGYVLGDLSRAGHPSEWARAAVDAFAAYQADRIVAEANHGGEMVAHTIWSVAPAVPVSLVHASRGKAVRAEPVASLFHRGLVHLVGSFPDLERQLCEWTPADPVSPDRLDALVWAITALFFLPDDLGGDEILVYDDPVVISPV